MDGSEVKSENTDMVLDTIPSSPPPPVAAQPMPTILEPPLKYRSWRKKYRKMKVDFDKRMDDATGLYLAEHKANEIAKRLKEQNDQLLELLLDLNEAISKNGADSAHSYALDLPRDTFDDFPSIPALPNRRSGLRSKSHDLSPLIETVAHTPVSMPDESSIPDDLLPASTEDLSLPAYLSPEQEIAYIAALDAQAATLPSMPASADSELILPPHIMRPEGKTLVTEHDFAVQHPLSVHSWLRKHQPHIFAGADLGRDGVGPDEPWGPPRRKTPPPSRRSKKDKERIAERERRAELQKKDWNGTEEAGDDESVFAGEEAGDAFGQGSRRRKKADESYRPKGGGSGRGKRKRADTLIENGGRESVKKARRLDATIATPSFGAAVDASRAADGDDGDVLPSPAATTTPATAATVAATSTADTSGD